MTFIEYARFTSRKPAETACFYGTSHAEDRLLRLRNLWLSHDSQGNTTIALVNGENRNEIVGSSKHRMNCFCASNSRLAHSSSSEDLNLWWSSISEDKHELRFGECRKRRRNLRSFRNIGRTILRFNKSSHHTCSQRLERIKPFSGHRCKRVLTNLSVEQCEQILRTRSIAQSR